MEFECDSGRNLESGSWTLNAPETLDPHMESSRPNNTQQRCGSPIFRAKEN
jgi:hypothetical protein